VCRRFKMRKTIKLSLIAASVLALTACNQEAKKEQADVKLDTVAQQQAYGIGASVGNFLNKDLADKKRNWYRIRSSIINAWF